MKKEVDLCDRCKKMISFEKCFICDLDMCFLCLPEFYINFSNREVIDSDTTTTEYTNILNNHLFGKVKETKKVKPKDTFAQFNCGVCSSCLKDLTKVLEHQATHKENGVMDALLELTKRLKKIVIASKL